MLKKHKKSIIIIIILIVACIIIKVVSKDSSNSALLLDRYLKTFGFEVTEDADMYSKHLSGFSLEDYYKTDSGSSEYLYLKISDVVLRDVLLEKEDDIERFFTGTYDYNTNTLTYFYEISYLDSYLYLTGTYIQNMQKVTCVLENSNNLSNSNSLKELSCDKASYLVKSFYKVANNLNEDDKLKELILS